MAKQEIHMGDVKTLFKITIKDGSSVVDISTATTKQIIFKKPDGSKLTKTASFFTTGADGILTYEIISSDLDKSGTWEVQAVIVLAAGGTWHSEIKNFEVYRNL